MTSRSRDEELQHAAPLLEHLFEQQVKRLYTAMPGVVVSYDEASRTAVVRGAIDLVANSGHRITRPDLADVPILFPSSAGFELSFPLTAGDDVLLVFSMRGLMDWKAHGSPAAPDLVSLMSEHDAIAIPGLRPRSRTDQATVRIEVSASAVNVVAGELQVNGARVLTA